MFLRYLSGCWAWPSTYAVPRRVRAVKHTWMPSSLASWMGFTQVIDPNGAVSIRSIILGSSITRPSSSLYSDLVLCICGGSTNHPLIGRWCLVCMSSGFAQLLFGFWGLIMMVCSLGKSCLVPAAPQLEILLLRTFFKFTHFSALSEHDTICCVLVTVPSND